MLHELHWMAGALIVVAACHHAVASRAPVAEVPAIAPHHNPKALFDTLGLLRDPEGHGAPWVRSMVLIMFRRGTDQPSKQATVNAIHGRVVGGFHLDDDGEYYVRIPGTTIKAIESTLRALRSMPQVEFASPMIVDSTYQGARRAP